VVLQGDKKEGVHGNVQPLPAQDETPPGLCQYGGSVQEEMQKELVPQKLLEERSVSVDLSLL